MTRTLGRRACTAPKAPLPSRSTRRARGLVMPVAVLLAGCAGGLIGPLPPVTKPSIAATVTVFRDASPVGFVGPIVLRIDEREVFRLWPAQQFSFALDPGSYSFYYTIGFNECQRVAYVEPRRSQRFRLAPNCARFVDPS